MKDFLAERINNIRLILMVLIFFSALLLWNNNINLRDGLRLSSQSSKAVLNFQQTNNNLHNLSLQHINNPSALHKLKYIKVKTNNFKKEIDKISNLPIKQKNILIEAYSLSRNLMTIQKRAMNSLSDLLIINNLQYINYQQELNKHLKQFNTLSENNIKELIETKVWFSVVYVLNICFFSIVLIFVINLQQKKQKKKKKKAKKNSS